MHLVFIFRGNCKILLKDKEKPAGQNAAYSFTYVSIWTDGFNAVFDKILRLPKNATSFFRIIPLAAYTIKDSYIHGWLWMNFVNPRHEE